MDTHASAATASPYRRHSHEIAAAVTLPAAVATLVAPGPPTISAMGAAAVTTTCDALVTRMGLIASIADPDAGVDDVRRFDPFHDETPPALRGRGPRPDRRRLRVAGDRCVAVWQAWRAEGESRDDRIGVAGAVAVGAWCAWALGSDLRAQVRAGHALDTWPDDPLALLVLRSVAARSAPTWQG